MAEDFTEDAVPTSGLSGIRTEELTDDALPAPGGLSKVVQGKPSFDKKKHDAATRRGLAIASFAVLVSVYGVLVGLRIFDVITMEELTGLIAASSGLQTLTAVAFAFYFAKSK
jgi:hypothetical protein